MKIHTEKVIEVSDWDSLVTETYKRPYCFQQQDGCQDRGRYSLTVPDPYAEDFENDTLPEVVNHEEMGVSFAAWKVRDPKQKLDSKDEWDRERGLGLWWERNFYPNIEVVANDLHAKGLLPAGEYSIDIDW